MENEISVPVTQSRTATSSTPNTPVATCRAMPPMFSPPFWLVGPMRITVESFTPVYGRRRGFRNFERRAELDQARMPKLTLA